MAILKSEILVEVNKNTKRNESDIDRPLREVLLDMSSRQGFLKTSASGTLDADAKATKPTDYKHPDELFITADAATLTEITFSEYLNEILAGFLIRGDEILVGPASAYASKAYTIYYGKLHDTDISADNSIEFSETFRAAIEFGVSAKIFRKLQMFNEAREHDAYYENEITKLQDGDSEPPAATQIRTWIRS